MWVEIRADRDGQVLTQTQENEYGWMVAAVANSVVSDKSNWEISIIKRISHLFKSFCSHLTKTYSLFLS